MAKVYSLHLIAIKAGHSGEEFEECIRAALAQSPGLPGVRMRLLKGDRGDRAGKYAVMFEFDSAERRAQLFPTAGPGAMDVSPEAQRWFASHGQVLGQWEQIATPMDVIYTDYVVVAE